MKKSKSLILSYILSIVFGACSYYFILNVFISLIIGLLFFLLLNFYVLKKLDKVKTFKKSLNTFSHFANSLIMQISVTPNATVAINEISKFLDEKQQLILQNDELLVKEKLDTIENNYQFPLYKVFKEIIVLYDTQGGDIIDMSIQLLNQIDNYIKNIEAISLDNAKKFSEVLVLWTFGFGALFYIKQILYDYYIEIIKIQNFQLIISGFFLMFLGTIFIMSKKYIDVKIGD